MEESLHFIPSAELDQLVVNSLTLTDGVVLILILLCLFLSAFFSGSEVSFFSLKPSHIDELRGTNELRDRRILELLNTPESLLATLLVANNFVNITVITLSDYLIGRIFDFSSAPKLGFLVQVIGTTFVILLVGEIIPKVFSQKNPLRMARINIGGLYKTQQVLAPVVKGLVCMGKAISSPLQKSKVEIDHDELSKAIDLTTDDADEKGVLREIVRFHQKTVAEVMQPRLEIKAIDIKRDFDEVKSFILEYEYSRIPVYKDRIDNVKGILYAKDLLPHLAETSSFAWQNLLREALFVPETMMLSHLLEEFRQEKKHIAIVVDEFGGTSGLVTMEDLLEEIVGDINDEYDEEEKLYIKNNDGSYTFDAKISLLDFVRVVKSESASLLLEVTEEAETLGGLLLEVKQDFPIEGEEINIQGHLFKVLEMGNHRISKILFTPQKESFL